MAWTTEDVAYLRKTITEEGCEAIARLLTAHDAEVAREAAEKAWEAGYGTGVYDERIAADFDMPEYRDPARLNPYRKPEPPKPFDTDAQLAADGLPSFPTIRKEDSK